MKKRYNNIKNDFYDLCIELAALSILQTKKTNDIKKARKIAQKTISSGYALEKFRKMIEYQGGNPKVVDNYSLLGKAKKEYIIKADKTGYINSIKTRQLGICSCMLGAGRLKTEDKIDWTAGITLCKKTGDVVKKGDVLAKLFYNKASVEQVANVVKDVFKICTIKPKKIKLIKDIII